MLTTEQVLALRPGASLHFDDCTRTVGPRGGVTLKVKRCRVNGAVKLWKTRPGEYRVPVKHGLRDCGYITPDNVRRFHLPADCPTGACYW